MLMSDGEQLSDAAQLGAASGHYVYHQQSSPAADRSRPPPFRYIVNFLTEKTVVGADKSPYYSALRIHSACCKESLALHEKLGEPLIVVVALTAWCMVKGKRRNKNNERRVQNGELSDRKLVGTCYRKKTD